MKTPIQMLADMRRDALRHRLLERTNNGNFVRLSRYVAASKENTEDASTQLDRLLTRQEYVGGAE